MFNVERVDSRSQSNPEQEESVPIFVNVSLANQSLYLYYQFCRVTLTNLVTGMRMAHASIMLDEAYAFQ